MDIKVTVIIIVAHALITEELQDGFNTDIIMNRKSNTGIPGLSFSWKRALGITQTKQKIARQTGIPTSRAGLERKLGRIIMSLFK